MSTIIYSLNKVGFELDFWQREIAGASTQDDRFLPFNHGAFLDPRNYLRAQLLDNLWFAKDPRLMAMYDALERLIRDEGADALVVDNANPYHPEYLLGLGIHKILRTSDGPAVAYERDFSYVHAFDQVLYHSPAYSPDLTMSEKLAYVGARRADFWPLALFDAGWDANVSEEELFAGTRDIDILFVGALHRDKMPVLSEVKKAFGKRCRLHGVATLKQNLYFKAKFRASAWVRPIRFEDYIPLYRRTKIGFNVHLRGDYTVGGFRLFELPANGVMQISDGGPYLDSFYATGSEVEGYRSTAELIAKIEHFLTHESERQDYARAAFRRTMRDHRFSHRMAQLAALAADGMSGRDVA
jgi:spore maturation protein CgeB